MLLIYVLSRVLPRQQGASFGHDISSSLQGVENVANRTLSMVTDGAIGDVMTKLGGKLSETVRILTDTVNTKSFTNIIESMEYRR